jgi:PAS domain S-box-containing protein
MKLATKISAAFWGMAFVVTGAMLFIIFLIVSSVTSEMIDMHLKDVTAAKAAHVETYLDMLSVSLGQLSKSVVLEEYLQARKRDPQNCQTEFMLADRRLRNTKMVNSNIASFFLMDAKGRIVVSSNEKMVDIDRSSDEVFLRGQKELHIKDVYRDKNGQPLISLSVPLRSSQSGEVLGVLAANINMNVLNAIIMRKLGRYESGEAYLVNKHGFMITPSRFIKDAVFKQRIETDHYKSLFDENNAKANVGLDYRGVRVLGIRANVPRMGWALLVEIDEQEALRPVRSIALVFFVFIIFTPLFIWLIGFLVGRKIAGPLQELKKSIQDFRTGFLPSHPERYSDDEVGEIARAFHLMAVDLKTSTTSIAALNTEMLERERLKVKLELTAKEWESTLDALSDMISIQDKDCSLLRVNKAYADAFKMSPQELVGRKCHVLVHGTGTPHPQCPHVQTIKTKMPTTVELFEPNLDAFLEVNVSPIMDDKGDVIATVHIAKNISKRKQAEEALRFANEEFKTSLKISESLRDDFEEARIKAVELAKVKGEFLANMSHEIRTPMNAILGFSDLLSKTQINDRQKSYLDSIQSGGRHLLSIIEDILNYSKIEAHKIKLESIEFDVRYLIHDVFKMILPRLEDKPLEVYVDIPKEIPRYLKGDPTRMRQIFVNLLNNAIKFTASGSIGIIVRLDDSLIEGRSGEIGLRFTVKDTGIGVPKDQQEKIFLAFEQADPSTTRKFGGTGLGLAIVRALVTAMQGKIWIESIPGNGSEFILTASFLKADPAFQMDIVPLSIKDLQAKRVLVVDDNVLAVQLASRYCQDLQMEVVATAASASEAIEHLKKIAGVSGALDLILTDVMMPDMDGYGFAKKVKEMDYFKNVKVIALTSDLRVGTANQAREGGFHGYLSKPVGADDLAKVITVVLGDNRKEGPIVTRHTAKEVSCAGKKILVVDDSVSNQELIKAYLDVLDCVADYAGSGMEAIEKLKASSYGLCFMDIQMPQMDGLEAARIIRAEINKDMPIIALTADIVKTSHDACLQAGMNDLLPKPVGLKELREKILQYASS